MKKLNFPIIALLLTFAFSGCPQQPETTADNSAADAAPANTAAPEKTSPAKDAETAGGAATPTEAVETFAAGMKEKDPVKVRSVLTAESVKMLEAGAKNEGHESLDEFVKSGKGGEQFTIDGEVRNEKIAGETATLEVSSKGKWEPVTLVKDGGGWKIAFDKN